LRKEGNFKSLISKLLNISKLIETLMVKPCCPAAAARMVKKISIGSLTVGIALLDDIIEEVCLMRLDDKKKIGEALLKQVKIYNYVPDSAEGEYTEALLMEYEKFCKTREAK